MLLGLREQLGDTVAWRPTRFDCRPRTSILTGVRIEHLLKGGYAGALIPQTSTAVEAPRRPPTWCRMHEGGTNGEWYMRPAPTPWE